MPETNNRIEEVIAKALYEQARQGADLLYELLHRFNPEPDERYELWTKKWGDWESADATIRKIYLIQARQICQLRPQPLDEEARLPLIGRERAESAVGETDCSGRKFTPVEKEDNIRYVLWGAEIQRDKDQFDGYILPQLLDSKESREKIAECYCADQRLDYHSPIGKRLGDDFADQLITRLQQKKEGS